MTERPGEPRRSPRHTKRLPNRPGRSPRRRPTGRSTRHGSSGSSLIFLFNFIPYVGSIMAVGVPVPLSFLKCADGPWKAVTILLLLLAIQRVSDNRIEPRLTGQRLGISPLLVLLALAFWAWMWGIVGMVLAVPLTVTAKIILENIRETQSIAALMSNR